MLAPIPSRLLIDGFGPHQTGIIMKKPKKRKMTSWTPSRVGQRCRQASCSIRGYGTSHRRAVRPRIMCNNVVDLRTGFITVSRSPVASTFVS